MVEASIDISKAIVILSYLIAIIGGFFTIRAQIRAERRIQDQKYARKESVNKDISNMEAKINTLDEIVKTNRKENMEAHRDIKNDLKDHIDQRFDDLKDYLKALNKKSA